MQHLILTQRHLDIGQ